MQFPYFFLTKYPEEVIQNCSIVKMGDWIQCTYEHCKIFTTLCSHPHTSLEMIMIFTRLTDKFQIDKSNMSFGGYWLGMNSQKQLGVGLLYPKIKLFVSVLCSNTLSLHFTIIKTFSQESHDNFLYSEQESHFLWFTYIQGMSE